MVYRLILGYRGEAYAGWQRQPQVATVQQTVEEAVAKLVRRDVSIVGAGRTDAGVHARAQAAHLDLSTEIPLRALVHGSNHLLPEDIRIVAAGRMPRGFHARKHASGKLYRYRLSRARVLSPLDALFVVGADRNLNVDAIGRALHDLVGRHDFSAFALAGGSHRDPHREIFLATLSEDGERLNMSFEGDGFLRGMVRSLVGTLLEVGLGRRSTSAFGALLEGGARGEAGPTAPARGLTLERVDYPPEWQPSEEYDSRYRGGHPAGSAGSPMVD
ncbi:MAG: tRNA pseudouridine(38-40) synthase TruA [Acidobacteriota bacterium]|nr:tRNA pseudouridine(38-40) synthase TruA [Acidobacteriota bacterium]